MKCQMNGNFMLQQEVLISSKRYNKDKVTSMPDKASVLDQRFLEQIQSRKGKEIFETLNNLMEALEKKNDPEMTEVHLVENMTSFIENFQIMSHNLSSYACGKRSLLGDKLVELREKESQSIFE